jgi:2-polyprenyl-3-methyl-5-hydroxy-6-metoxy-1,4-benzoquinol methylase
VSIKNSTGNGVKTYSSSAQFSNRFAVNCPLCATESSRPLLWQCDGFSYVRCNQCGLVYQKWQPNFDELSSHYDENYTAYESANEQNFLGLTLKGLIDVNFADIEATLPTKSVLDIGCATGFFLQHFKQQGYQTTGIEIDSHSVALARQKGLTIIDKVLEKSELPSESFSLVHSSHVIEHVPNPKVFLNECFRLTQPGGYCLITTPNTASLQAHLFKQQWRSAISDHLALFSSKLLQKSLTEAGFKIIKVVTWGGWALGAKPKFVKKPLDKWAKQFGFGDVVSILAKKD